MKKINNNYFARILMIVGFAFFINSCSKEFLDEPYRDQTPADFFASEGAAGELVNAVYNQLYQWETHSFAWIGVSSIASDDADKGSIPGDNGLDKDQLDDYTFTSSSGSFDQLWIGHYKGIARSNVAIRDLPGMNIEGALKARLMGECKFLRAYYYFNLVRCFGGVPKVITVPVTPDEVEATNIRASKEEIYAQIELDLNDAVTGLPVTYPATDAGRATKGAAMALLAKVSMYQQKWGAVKSNCDAVITMGYSLLPKYENIWREVGEFSSESIWEINAKGNVPTRGIQQYTEVQSPRGGPNDRGWGFNTPSSDLVNAYEPGDLRKAATILNVPQTTWDGTYSTTGTVGPYYNYKAFVSRTNETWGNDNGNNNKNLRILRMGDLLLMKAEAENELDNLDVARAALDSVRKRAGLSNTPAINKAEMKEAIWKERRVEMAFEHDRMFDLRRQSRAGVVMRANGKPFVDGKHELFPIPQNQIDLSGSLLQQNPNY